MNPQGNFALLQNKRDNDKCLGRHGYRETFAPFKLQP